MLLYKNLKVFSMNYLILGFYNVSRKNLWENVEDNFPLLQDIRLIHMSVLPH